MSDIIRIGPVDYKVEFVKDLHSRSTNEDLYGRIDYGYQKIQIDDNLGSDMIPAVLWHEVLHAISDQCNLGLSEEQVCALGYQVVNLLKDNEELAAVYGTREALVPTSECEA